MNREKRFLYFLLTTVFPVLISSCSAPVMRPLFRSADDRVLDTLTGVKEIIHDPTHVGPYRIEAEDMLEIRNATYQQIAEGGGSSGGGSGGGNQRGGNGGGGGNGYRVEADGYVTLPKAGRVYVLGLTRQEATARVQKVYRDSLLADPVIDVSVLNPRVTVLGMVKQEGTFFLDRENISAVEVLGMAGGLAENGDPKTMKIVRGDKTNPNVIYVNLENLKSLAAQGVTVQNKDIIYIDSDKRYQSYQKKQSTLTVIQTGLLIVSTGIVIFSTFFK